MGTPLVTDEEVLSTGGATHIMLVLMMDKGHAKSGTAWPSAVLHWTINGALEPNGAETFTIAIAGINHMPDKSRTSLILTMTRCS
jgi:hypothetical protein